MKEYLTLFAKIFELDLDIYQRLLEEEGKRL